MPGDVTLLQCMTHIQRYIPSSIKYCNTKTISGMLNILETTAINKMQTIHGKTTAKVQWKWKYSITTYGI